MSGFIGRVGNSCVKEKLLSALNLLQFKDDDSTGVLFCNKEGQHLYRVVGKVDELVTLIPEEVDGYMGIAHTRWSTYMHQVLENVYPLSSENGYVTLVVNGLIDNIQMIKRRLVKRGYSFRSSSAVEVVANLIEDGAVENEDPLRALHRAMQQLEGDYALLAVFNGNCKKIFFAKNGVPLIIGKNHDGMVICTDYTPIADQADEYYYPNDGELGYLTSDNMVLYDGKLKQRKPSFTEVSVSEKTLELGDYPHYMLKEIEEAPGVIRRLINHYFEMCIRDRLYIDENYRVLDFCDGLKDLDTNTLRVIGNPYTRFAEDPLRIIRALRFVAKFKLNIDPLTENAIRDLAHLVKKLNPEKVKAEIRKVGEQEQNIFKKLMNMYKL